MKATQINLPNPCSEDWNTMKELSSGRQCQTCNTFIRDFSQLSYSQVHYILKQSNGRTCGRFNVNQLNRDLDLGKRRNAPDLLGVILGMTLLLTTYPVLASEESLVPAPISLIEEIQKEHAILKDGHEYIKVRFQVIDANTADPAIFVKVILKNEQNVVIGGAVSDLDGYVTLNLSPDQMKEVSSVTFNSLEHSELILDWNQGENWDLEGINIIELTKTEESELMMVGIIIEVKNPRKVQRQQKRESRKLLREEKRMNN
ncbi:MAG: hypothetical protein ACFHU9_07040 [Fluviicola sp.]